MGLALSWVAWRLLEHSAVVVHSVAMATNSLLDALVLVSVGVVLVRPLGISGHEQRRRAEGLLWWGWLARPACIHWGADVSMTVHGGR